MLQLFAHGIVQIARDGIDGSELIVPAAKSSYIIPVLIENGIYRMVLRYRPGRRFDLQYIFIFAHHGPCVLLQRVRDQKDIIGFGTTTEGCSKKTAHTEHVISHLIFT